MYPRQLERIKLDLLSPEEEVRIAALSEVFSLQDLGELTPSEAEEIMDYGERYRG